MNLEHRERARYWLDHAIFALEGEAPERALVHVRQALTHEPGLIEARQVQARALLAQGEPRLALAALDAAAYHNPGEDEPTAFARLRLQALTAAGKDELALDLAERLGQVWPEDRHVRRVAAELYLKLGRQDEARAMLAGLLAEGEEPVVRRLLAELSRQEASQGGIELLVSQGETERDPAVTLRLARQCRAAERLLDAETHYQHLLEVCPDQATAWREAGEVADELGNMPAALTRLEQAVRLRAAGATAELRSLARAQMDVGGIARAGRTWWHLLKRDEGDAEAWAGLAVCAHLGGRTMLAGRARRTLNQMAGVSERRNLLASHWRRVAAARARTRSSPAASPLAELVRSAGEALSRAADVHPRGADIHYHHAVCRAEQGHCDEAQAAVDRALEQNPRYAAARRLKARLTGWVASAA
jgi:tetratricopeptide (TPR) repeat protein